MAKYNNNYIAIDVETGGLPSRLKKKATLEVALTELAMVAIDGETLKIVDKKSWLIKPYSPDLIYDPEAAAVSGITKQMCEEQGMDIEVAFKEMLKFITKNKIGSKLPYLVGHNMLSFDLDFIEGIFEYCKTDIQKYFNADIKDTLLIAREKWIEAPSFNLQSCCNMAGIEHVQAHRALPDTVVTADLFIHFMKCLRQELGVKQEEKKVERFRETFQF
jgi:DNA polymerase III epsilon subunit-like protein